MTLSKQSKNILTLFAIASVLALAVAWSSVVYARISSPRGDEIVADAESIDVVMSRLWLPNQSVASSTVLVDLSEAASFKHPNANSGSVDVTKIRVDWSTNVAASTTLKFGVIASTSPSGAVQDIFWFDTVRFDSGVLLAGHNGQGGMNQFTVLDYSPATLRTRISSASSTDFITGDISYATSQFATTTALTSPLGVNTTTPGVGDVVMKIFDQSGNATTSVSTFYKVTE